MKKNEEENERGNDGENIYCQIFLNHEGLFRIEKGLKKKTSLHLIFFIVCTMTISFRIVSKQKKKCSLIDILNLLFSFTSDVLYEHHLIACSSCSNHSIHRRVCTSSFVSCSFAIVAIYPLWWSSIS